MNFNSTTNPPFIQQYSSFYDSKPKPSFTINGGLNMPMIDRVHKARPGCSACGKKAS
jgi:hypothetical protein